MRTTNDILVIDDVKNVTKYYNKSHIVMIEAKTGYSGDVKNTGCTIHFSNGLQVKSEDDADIILREVGWLQ